MKEQAIQKINKIGKISSIIALIGKILVGIGIAAALIGTIVCFVFPEELFKVSVVGDMVMEVDFSSLGVEMSEAELLEARESLEVEMEGEEPEFTEFELTASKMMMKGDFEQFSLTMRDLAGILVLALITLIMTFITLIFISALCKAFRDCESPFEEGVIKKMQNFAFALIPWTVVATVTNSISDSVMNHKFSLNFTLDLGVVLIVLVVLVLVHIFKYGAVLQQESDETL
ncbi:MAG: DUF2975 domain-containing protein [Lachnospiraceae bacterium]|nr:DUF2975 domain-containing protein [Lachnospiraceae bacterium]